MEPKPQPRQEEGKERAKKCMCGVLMTKKKGDGESTTTQKHPTAIQLFNFGGGGERGGRSE